MTRTPLTEDEQKFFDGALLADGFEDALIGLGFRFHFPVAIYDLEKCLEVLIHRDGMTCDEAQEYFDVNVAGAYVGDSTPIFIHTFKRRG